MCEFCTKHGEGEKWYLNAKNYGDDLFSDIRRRKFITDFFYWTNKKHKRLFSLPIKVALNMPIIKPTLKAIIKRTFIYEHWGQVIPIEDVEKVLSLTNSVVRIPCICRKITTGKEVRSCFVVTLNPRAVGIADILDQSFFGGPDIAQFEKVDKTLVLNFMREQEKKGLFHSIWTFRTPFIGGICNCDDSGCISKKMYNEVRPIFFKAEYVAEIDKDKCVGCKACLNICPFKAIEYDVINKKTTVDYQKCYGCGICRAVCKKDAIILRDRNAIPEVAHLW